MLFRIRDEQGAALAFVLLVLVLTTIFLVGISSIFHANLTQTVAQEDSVEAYYLAQSGVELAFAALIQEGAGGVNDTLLYDSFSIDTHPTIGDTTQMTYTFPSTDFPNGSVTIVVKAILEGGERWVQIESTGTLDSSGIDRIVTLKFSVSNTELQIQS